MSGSGYNKFLLNSRTPSGSATFFFIFTNLISLCYGNLDTFALPAQSSLQEPALFSVCCGYGDVTMNPDPVPGYRKNCVGPLAFSVAEPCHFCSAPVVTSKNSVLIIHSIIFTPP